MRTSIIFIIFLLLTLRNWGQDTIKHKSERLEFDFQANGNYKEFSAGRYIQPSNVLTSNNFKDHQFDRFTQMHNNGYTAGFVVTYRFYKNWHLGAGILYSLRNDIYERDRDTTIKYGNGSTVRDLHNALRYDYSYENIELPLLIKFTLRKFSFYTGIQMTLLSHREATYTYLVYQQGQRITSAKTFESYRSPYVTFPFFNVSYDLKIKKFHFYPFLGIEGSPDKQKSYYLKCGLIVPLIKI